MTRQSTHRYYLASIFHDAKGDRSPLACFCETTHVVPDCQVGGGASAKRGKR